MSFQSKQLNHNTSNVAYESSNKIKKIRNELRNLAKAEISSYNSLKVMICNEERKDESFKKPATFKSFIEDMKYNTKKQTSILGEDTADTRLALQEDEIDSSDISD